MTLLQYITSLQDEGLSQEEIFAKSQEWKKNNPQEKPIEEKTDEVEVKTDDSQTKDPSLESKDSTGSESEDGSSQPANNSKLTPEQQAEYDKITAVAKPNEVINDKGYDFKYDNDGVYYYKPEGSEDDKWKTYEDKQGPSNLSIASKFGHSSFDTSDYYKTKKLLKKGEELYVGVDGQLEVSDNKQYTLTADQLKLEKEFIKSTSLNDKDDSKILKQTNDWFAKTTVPEYKIEYERAGSGSDAYQQKTKTRIGDKPNPEWVEAQIKSKKAWDKLSTKPKNISEQAWIEQNMKDTYSSNLTQKKKEDKIESWIENQETGFDWKKAAMMFSPAGASIKVKDVFDRSDKQKIIEGIQKVRKLNLDNKSKDATNFADVAKNTIDGLSTQIELLSKAKYQTPEEAEKGKALITKLHNKRKDVIKLYEKKVDNLNEMLLKPEYKDIGTRLDYLERNFNNVAIYSENVKVGIANAGVALADFAHMVADAPNAFGIEENPYAEKVFSVVSPIASLAAKFVKTQPYQQTREKAKDQVANYVEQTMQGIPHAQSLSDLKDGNDWGRYFSTMLGSQTLNTAIMFGTGGAALPILTAQAVGGSYGEMEKENKERIKAGLPAFSPFQMYGVAMGNGLLEYGSEKISLGIIGRSRAAFKAMGPSVKQGFTTQISNLMTGSGAIRAGKAVGYYGLDVAKEGGSEGFVEFGGNLFDRYVLGKDVNLLDGVPDSIFSGSIMSGLVYKAPALAAGISSMVQGPDTNTKIANNRQKILDLENTLTENPEMSEANRARLNNQIVKLVKNSSNEINTTLNRFTDMDRSEIDTLSDIELQVNTKRKAIDEVNADPNFNNKDAEISRIKNEIIELEIEKNNVLEPYIQADAKQSKKGLSSSETVELTSRMQEGADVVAEQLGDVGIDRFDTTEDIVGAFETLKAEGINLEIETNEDGSIKDAKDQGYGIIATLPDGTQQIIINNASSQADGTIPADNHELVHAFSSKMDPAKLAKMGMDLKNKLDNDPYVELDANTKSLLQEYEADLNDGKISEATFYEEVMAVTSDALNTGSIKISDPGKFAQTWNFLETIGWKQSFKDGDQVIDFLKDFNKDVLSGKGLSQQTLDKAEVDMGLETEVDLGVVKSSKASQAKNQKLVREAKRGDLKAVDALIKDNSGIILQKLGFNKDIGDVTSQDILNVVKDQAIGKGLFKGRQKPLFDNYNPTKGEVSTYLGDIVGKRKAEIFKAAGLDATKFDTVSTDAPQAQQVADTTEQTEFDEVTNEEKGRKKVYPSNMPSISKNIKPESIASINEGAKRDILLNASKGIDAIVSSIKSEGKITAKILGKDVGTFSKGWPKFVNELVNDGLTKVIPAAALKRRFGNVLNIKKTGTTPTKRVNPTTGKVTTFNKPVYEIPKADNQSLIDYFTGQEKRRTSLLEVLGQDLVVEQLQELKNDSDFMTKLDSLTDGKASEIMENLDSKLDTRNLEDTSLDTVKASKKVNKTPTNKQEQDDIVIEQGAEPITQDVEGVSRFIDFLTNPKGLISGFGDLTNIILKPSTFSGAGNSATTEKGGGAIGRGFKLITNRLRTRSKDLSSTLDSLSKGEVGELSVIKEQVKNSTNEKNVSKEDRKAVQDAIGPQKGVAKATKNQSKQYSISKGKKIIYDGLRKAIKSNSLNIAGIREMIGNQNANAGLGRNMATLNSDGRGKDKDGRYEEHWFQASQWNINTLKALGKSDLIWNAWTKFSNSNYYQEIINNKTQTAVDKTYDITMPDGSVVKWKSKDKLHPLLQQAIDKGLETGDFSDANKLADIRKYPGKDVHTEVNPFTHGRNGISDAVRYDIIVSKDLQANPNIQHATSAIINEVIIGKITTKQAQERIDAYKPIAKLEAKSSKKNTSTFGDKLNTEMTIAEQLTILGTYDKAARNARAIDTPKKGISVFDFDDTLARTKEKVIVNNADGSSTEISAAQFAETANELEANGATFDFSNFEGVADGTKKGPLADLALKRQDKFGSKDIFVLTARPQASAQAIKTFLDGIGLNLPLSNITGLANGSPGAKGNWVAGKAAEGYNDFYFADDAYKNVEAVQEVLSQVDVDSKVQIAKASKKKVFNQVFNDIIENSTGIKSYKVYSPAKAQTIGASKGKFDFLIPASAEDFTGLLYKTLGKGKVGDAQMAFYKTNLLDPYNRAEIAVVNAKIQAANDFKALKNNLKTLPKSLSKLTGIGKFTFSQASRVAVWTRQGMTVPGLSKTDLKQLNDFIDNNAELNTFVDELIKIQKGKPYPKPTKNWVSGTITSDITTEINKVNRKEYMQEFQENADIIFNDENMAKLEAAYGPKYVEALKDSLRRMKSGSNRPIGGSRVVNEVLDWLNNSVGAVMFLNTRSAILQTISAVNFIQLSGPNNLLAAGKAFANQKQYWKDFMTLMNSPYLVERRNGLKINVSESEIADAVAESKNKPKAALAYLLSKGFVMTRFADSFAIASGGSTFYRNTVDALVKSGMDQKSAEKKAFDDFRALAEESQQSSNPSRISQQQASAAGRVILAFANTPMQYARIIKKSSQDLINGRGDWKSNVAKIAYYGAMQNVVFNALQQALFALAFSDDEEEKEKQKKDKTGRIVNGMVDSLIKGAGIQGQAIIALKNAIVKIAEEADKNSPEFQKAVDDLLGFSPPLSAKIRKIKGGLKAFSWSRKEMKEKGFDLNNPAYLASAQVISGLTNIPVDRAVKKLNNIRAIFSDSSAKWQKIAMALGWSTWDVGLPFYGVEDKEVQTPQTILRDKVSKMKKETSGPQQKQMLLDLGLTKKEIKALRYEENRVKKIIELQNKNKK